MYNGGNSLLSGVYNGGCTLPVLPGLTGFKAGGCLFPSFSRFTVGGQLITVIAASFTPFGEKQRVIWAL